MPRRPASIEDIRSPDVYVVVNVESGPDDVNAVVSFTAFDPIADDDPLLSLIGRVAVAAARLEQELDVTIWAVMNVDAKVGACLTSLLVGPAMRIAALRNLFEQRSMSDAVRLMLKKLDGAVNNLGDKRNRILHDAWYSGDDGAGMRLHKTSRSDRSFGLVEVGSAEMQATVEAFSAAISKTRELHAACMLELRGPDG